MSEAPGLESVDADLKHVFKCITALENRLEEQECQIVQLKDQLDRAEGALPEIEEKLQFIVRHISGEPKST